MYKRGHSGQRTGYWIYGKYPVLHALRNPQRECLELVLTDVARQFLIANGIRVEQLKIKYQMVTNEAVQMLVPNGAVHQGIALQTRLLVPYSLHEILDGAATAQIPQQQERSIIVVCDQITDPHNFGAILRSSAAFGAKAVIVTGRNQAKESAVVAKAAAGMLELVPIAEVVNLADALRLLKENGYWIIGLDAAARDDVKAAARFDKIALVLGAEGEGMRHLTTKNCDMLVRIPMAPGVESLNVSNSAAIALYALTNMASYTKT